MSEVPLQEGVRLTRVPGSRVHVAVLCALKGQQVVGYWGTSLIRNRPTLAPYSRFVSRALWWSSGLAVSYEPGTPVILLD